MTTKFFYGNNNQDSLKGDYGDNFLYGRDGDDFLDGNSEDDYLYGGYHNDYLQGDFGDDHLYGGSGQDTLTGGKGADKFVFTNLDAVDLITDFNLQEGDKIVFDSLATGIAEPRQLTVNLSPDFNNSSEIGMITSLYVDNQKIMTFDGAVPVRSEHFEFI